MNNSKVKARNVPIESVVKNILAVRKISASDRQVLRLALFSLHSLSITEQDQIQTIYEELEAGRISLIK
ncbi:hypothetical protein ACP6PL_07185 [Dapis sp. BLCC M126]|uniref:hypothetical protein n=1 Tax=Dapis sp. BLCC M126 TaxID=3400189 RepID=UPI003CF5004D